MINCKRYYNYEKDNKGYLLFQTPLTLHMFYHSLGYCDTDTAHDAVHALDKENINEKCLACNIKLLKINHVTSALIVSPMSTQISIKLSNILKCKTSTGSFHISVHILISKQMIQTGLIVKQSG